MTQYTHCTLCNTEANEPFTNRSKNFHSIDCPNCGRYLITLEALLELPSDLTADEKQTLSEYTRRVSDQNDSEVVTLSLDGPNNYHELLERLNKE
jgi:hypothetical protein